MTFPIQEFKKRYEKARELMKRKNLDALLITEKSNYSYFTAHRTIGWTTKTRPIILILPLEGDPTLVIHSWEIGNAQSSCPWIKDIRTWTDLPFNIAPLLEPLRNLNLGKSKIGAELGYEQRLNMPLDDFEKLRRELPKTQFEDASEIFWKLRMIKSEAEIKSIRKACEIASEAIEKTLEDVRKGMTEREIGKMLYIHMMELGADRPGVAAICAGPDSYERESQLPTESIISPGNELFIDTGCVYNEYWSDMSRAATLGKPSEKQKEMHNLFQEATEKHIEMVRPGVKASDIVKSCLDYVRRKGLKTWGVGRMGHGIGLDFTEPPSITLNDTTSLEEGMVLTIEPGTITPYGVFCTEDVIVVRKDGSEMLTTAPRELQEIRQSV
jgi:Xaa-Pro aminopeptidase